VTPIRRGMQDRRSSAQVTSKPPVPGQTGAFLLTSAVASYALRIIGTAARLDGARESLNYARSSMMPLFA
jgi:hypothetical protein